MRPIKQTLQVFVALYFVLFVGLIVPHHLSEYWSCCDHPLTYGQTDTGNDTHHNPSECQICLTHGDLSASVILFQFTGPAEHSVSTVATPVDRPVAGFILTASSRAPPLS